MKGSSTGTIWPALSSICWIHLQIGSGCENSNESGEGDCDRSSFGWSVIRFGGKTKALDNPSAFSQNSPLSQRWHPDILACLSLEKAVSQTRDMTFAEIEELKNLLIQHFLDEGVWDWSWARRQFRTNREEFRATSRRGVGFGFAEVGANDDDDDWA